MYHRVMCWTIVCLGDVASISANQPLAVASYFTDRYESGLLI